MQIAYYACLQLCSRPVVVAADSVLHDFQNEFRTKSAKLCWWKLWLNSDLLRLWWLVLVMARYIVLYRISRYGGRIVAYLYRDIYPSNEIDIPHNSHHECCRQHRAKCRRRCRQRESRGAWRVISATFNTAAGKVTLIGSNCWAYRLVGQLLITGKLTLPVCSPAWHCCVMTLTFSISNTSSNDVKRLFVTAIDCVLMTAVYVPVGLSLPYTLRFGVKFYAADPCKLFEEITRYVASS